MFIKNLTTHDLIYDVEIVMDYVLARDCKLDSPNKRPNLYFRLKKCGDGNFGLGTNIKLLLRTFAGSKCIKGHPHGNSK